MVQDLRKIFFLFHDETEIVSVTIATTRVSTGYNSIKKQHAITQSVTQDSLHCIINAILCNQLRAVPIEKT